MGTRPENVVRSPTIGLAGDALGASDLAERASSPTADDEAGPGQTSVATARPATTEPRTAAVKASRVLPCRPD